MVPLSGILKRKANRLIHFVVVPVVILWVVVPAFMPSLSGDTSLAYVFFTIVEVVTMLAILLGTWCWPEKEESNNTLSSQSVNSIKSFE